MAVIYSCSFDHRRYMRSELGQEFRLTARDRVSDGGSVAKYLISFPSAAMVVPDDEWEAVGCDAHAVIDEAKAAGVYVFGGGIDEDVPPALVSADGAVAEGVISVGAPLTAASPYLNCPRARRPSRGPRASRKRVAAPRATRLPVRPAVLNGSPPRVGRSDAPNLSVNTDAPRARFARATDRRLPSFVRAHGHLAPRNHR